MVTMNTWLPWLLVMVLPWISHAEFLKSMGDIRVLEGHELTIDWLAYSDEDREQPCNWRYAVNTTSEEHIFLAWDAGQRREFGDKFPWQFTRTQEPCKGGIRRMVSLQDAGMYRMETEAGYSLKMKDTQTQVSVYDGAALSYKVILSDSVLSFTLKNGTDITLTPITAAKPVQVSVELSSKFPSTQVTISRDSQIVPCTPESCQAVMDVPDGSDYTILIVMETGIHGADVVRVQQDVKYVPPVDKTAKNAAIVFGVLFFILLTLIIVAIVLLVLKNRKMRQTEKLERIKDPESANNPKMVTFKQVKKGVKHAAKDLKAAFKSKKESAPVSDLEAYHARLAEDISLDRDQIVKDEKRYGTQETNFQSLVEGTRIHQRDCSSKCNQKREEMEYLVQEMEHKKGLECGLSEAERSQLMGVQYLLNRSKPYQDDLQWLESDLRSFEEDAIKNREKINGVREIAAEVHRKVGKQPDANENSAPALTDQKTGAKQSVDDEDKPATAPKEEGEEDTVEEAGEESRLNPSPKAQEDKGIRILREIQQMNEDLSAIHAVLHTIQSMSDDLDSKAKFVDRQKSRIITIDDDLATIKLSLDAIKKGWQHEQEKSPAPTAPTAVPTTSSTPAAEEPTSSNEQNKPPKKTSFFGKKISKNKRKSGDGSGDK